MPYIGIKNLLESISVKNLAVRDKVLLGFAVSSVLPLLTFIYLFLDFWIPEPYQVIKSREFINPELLVLLVVILSLLGVTMALKIAESISDLVEKTRDVYAYVEADPYQETDELMQLSRNFSLIIEKMHEQMRLAAEFEKELQNANEHSKAANLELKDLAVRDELTGLFNRRFFRGRLREELKRAMRYNHPLCLIMVDIDDFKAVNDKFGHAAGDTVLREFARLLTDCFREVDTVTRYGGEEFAIILPETKIQAARGAAERTRRKIEKYVFLKGTDGQQIRITASLGVFSCNMIKTINEDLEDIMHKADHALYVAKEQGKNRVVEYSGDGLSLSAT